MSPLDPLITLTTGLLPALAGATLSVRAATPTSDDGAVVAGEVPILGGALLLLAATVIAVIGIRRGRREDSVR